MGAQTVAEVVYFVSGEDGKTGLSDGETVIGHVKTVGVAFEIKPVAGLMLDGIQTHPVSIEAGGSRSRALAAQPPAAAPRRLHC
jgi:hypothetical protein